MRRILDLLAALDRAEVDTVVVGGVAVVLRGHARMTVDLDLALDLAPGNVLAVLDVLTNAGLVPRLPVPAAQFADADVRRSWVEERNLIAMKRASGRPQDLADVDALSRIFGLAIVDDDEHP